MPVVPASWGEFAPRRSLVGEIQTDPLFYGAYILPFWEGAGLRIFGNEPSWYGTVPVASPSPFTWQRRALGRSGLFGGFTPFNVSMPRPLIGDTYQDTILVVFNTTSGSTGTLYSEGQAAGGSNNIVLGTNSAVAGDVRLNVADSDGSSNLVSGALSANDGNWHVVISRERGRAKRDLWFDGAQVASTTTNMTGTRTLTNSRIGAWFLNGGSGENFVGGYALLVVWPRRALPDSEMIRVSRNPMLMVARPPRLNRTQMLALQR